MVSTPKEIKEHKHKVATSTLLLLKSLHRDWFALTLLAAESHSSASECFKRADELIKQSHTPQYLHDLYNLWLEENVD